MVTSFERMRIVREYRTPRGIRGYTKMIVFFLPIILAPYFAFSARVGAMSVQAYGERNPSCQNGNPYCGEMYKSADFTDQAWAAYFSAAITALVFGSLQAVQDTLDDPFDGIGVDDIDLHLITAWAPSALWEVRGAFVILLAHAIVASCVCGSAPTVLSVWFTAVLPCFLVAQPNVCTCGEGRVCADRVAAMMCTSFAFPRHQTVCVFF
jgi:hypothetical protein